MMNAQKIAKKILTKDTVYGSFDNEVPTDDELSEYFAMFIEEYAKEYHESQTVVDNKEKIIKDKEDKKWWM